MCPAITDIDWLRRQIARHGYPLAQGALTALVVLIAVMREDLRQPFTFAAALLVPSQVCLIALWAILSMAHPAVRLGRAFLWSGGLYFCIVGPASIKPAGLPTTWPLLVALAMTGLGAGAALGALVIRSNGWRLDKASHAREPDSPERRPHQFRLADAFGWTTMLCVFLALGALAIPRFAAGEAEPLTGNSDIVSPVLSGVCIALVIGAMAALVFWLVLVDAAASGWFLRKYWGGLLILVLAALWLDHGGPFGMGPPPFEMVFGLIFGFGLPLAINTLLLREFGWRLARVGGVTESHSTAEKRSQCSG